MGRFETPVNPGDGPVQHFAYDLRQLRAAAGGPPYRVLAGRAHYSVAALSQAAAGRALPSLPVTLGFVRGCGGDVAAWEQRWHEVNAVLHPPVNATKAPALTCTDTSRAGDAAQPAGRSGGPLGRGIRPRLSWRRTLRVRTSRWRLAAVTATALALVTAALVLTTGHRGSGTDPRSAAETRPPAVSPRPCPSVSGPRTVGEPVADCSDPQQAGCSSGTMTLATTEVRVPPSVFSGWLQLRYSPHCRTAWPRFQPADDWRPGPGMMVRLWAVRPADLVSTYYEVEFGTEAIFGDMLRTEPGCVLARMTMVSGSDQYPTTTTGCRSSDAG